MICCVSSLTVAKIRRTVVAFPVPGERVPAPEEPGEFPDSGVVVVERVGDEGELKDVGVPEEDLVVAEEGQACHGRLEKIRLLKAGRVRAENE